MLARQAEEGEAQKTQSPRQALNKETELPQTSVPIPYVPDESVHQERGDSVERATTTATSLEAMQDNGGPRHQETMRGASVQTRFERESKLSYDSPLGGGNTPQSDDYSMTLQELTDLCTRLSDKVLALEIDLGQTNKVYGTAYTKLILKVKKLEKTVKTSQARRRANSLLPTTFWPEAVNTACYVQNRVLVTKPYNKTPYELLLSRQPSISFMRHFGCPVTILNTLDPLETLMRRLMKGSLLDTL
ncbi:ribonuclease H-like domain-containing protein [Tanacetum coccineum]